MKCLFSEKEYLGQSKRQFAEHVKEHQRIVLTFKKGESDFDFSISNPRRVGRFKS